MEIMLGNNWMYERRHTHHMQTAVASYRFRFHTFITLNDDHSESKYARERRMKSDTKRIVMWAQFALNRLQMVNA